MHILNTSLILLSWSALSSSHPTWKMSSAIANVFGSFLNISSIFQWNVLATVEAPKKQSGILESTN